MSTPEYPPEMAWLVTEADGINEDVLRYELESGKHAGSPLRVAAAKVSLGKRQDARAFATSEKRDAREEETLAISRRSLTTAEDALATAKSANQIASEQLSAARRNARYAMYAAAIAAVAAIVSAKDEIWLLIAKFL